MLLKLFTFEFHEHSENMSQSFLWEYPFLSLFSNTSFLIFRTMLAAVVRVTTDVMKFHDHKQPGFIIKSREGRNLSRAETWKQVPKPRPWWSEWCLLACWSWFSQPIFLENLEPTGQGWHHPQRVGRHPFITKEMPPTGRSYN